MVVCLCLPGFTSVTTKHGIKRIDQLLPCDQVLTIARNKSVAKWTTFYTWGHIQADHLAEFIQMKVSNGKELYISSDHLLFVDGEKGRRVAKRAGNLVQGDKLFHINETNNSLELLPILEISTVSISGVYAPFTMSGDFLANGFLVACYANVDNFEMAHAALAPLRAWYNVIRSNLTDGKQGIHVYARKLMKIREFLSPRSKNVL